MTMAEGVALICTVTGLGAGGLVWIVAAMMSPLKESIKGDRQRLEVLIENNTAAMLDIKTIVRDHDAKIADHHVRIAVIETRHEGVDHHGNAQRGTE